MKTKKVLEISFPQGPHLVCVWYAGKEMQYRLFLKWYENCGWHRVLIGKAETLSAILAGCRDYAKKYSF